MKVVLLADRIGARLSEETPLRPKPMVDFVSENIEFHFGVNF